MVIVTKRRGNLDINGVVLQRICTQNNCAINIRLNIFITFDTPTSENTNFKLNQSNFPTIFIITK